MSCLSAHGLILVAAAAASVSSGVLGGRPSGFHCRANLSPNRPHTARPSMWADHPYTYVTLHKTDKGYFLVLRCTYLTLLVRVHTEGCVSHPPGGSNIFSYISHRNADCTASATRILFKFTTVTALENKSWICTVCRGRMGDGPKWVCDPHRIKPKDCLVYSFGSNNNFFFEESVLREISPGPSSHVLRSSQGRAASAPWHRRALI